MYILVATLEQLLLLMNHSLIFSCIVLMKCCLQNEDIFSSITSGVITMDLSGQINMCNRAAEIMLGLSSAQVIGNQLSGILPSLEAVIQPYVQTVIGQDKHILDLEITHDLPNKGRSVWHLNFSPLKDSDLVTRGTTIVLDDLTENRQLEASRRLLDRMVSPAVINQIDLDSLQIGGKRAEITILFADLQGFTSYSEGRSPEELVTILNQYLAVAVDAILAEDGTIDKFMGDAIMAWFNAPLFQPDHPLRAIRAALTLQKAIQDLHGKFPITSHLSFGIGIHSGEVIIGLIGTEKRVDYTVIGNNVNLTKRIQENAVENQILISAKVYEKVKDQVLARECPPLNVKGITGQLQVFEVIGLIGSPIFRHPVT